MTGFVTNSAVKFHYIPPECIDFIPIAALRYLEDAIEGTPHSVVNRDTVLMRAKHGIGQFYIVEKDNGVLGILYLMFYETEEGRILNINFLGGQNLRTWGDALRNFIRGLMMDTHASELVVVGREGWIKFFPELRVTGAIYSARVLH